jgi:hypothetical protein
MLDYIRSAGVQRINYWLSEMDKFIVSSIPHPLLLPLQG